MGNYVETDVKTSHLAKSKYIDRIDIQARKIKKEERYQEKEECTVQMKSAVVANASVSKFHSGYILTFWSPCSRLARQ